jgi:hypothetical protein
MFARGIVLRAAPNSGLPFVERCLSAAAERGCGAQGLRSLGAIVRTNICRREIRTGSFPDAPEPKSHQTFEDEEEHEYEDQPAVQCSTANLKPTT